MGLLRYGFTAMQLPVVMANTHPENTGSQHVLLKCGLHRQGERAYAHPIYAPFGQMPYFERSASDWLAEFSSTG